MTPKPPDDYPSVWLGGGRCCKHLPPPLIYTLIVQHICFGVNPTYKRRRAAYLRLNSLCSVDTKNDTQAPCSPSRTVYSFTRSLAMVAASTYLDGIASEDQPPASRSANGSVP